MDADRLSDLLRKPRYPGMSDIESEVTRRWIQAHGAEYDSIEFQVHVGDGDEPLADQPEYLRALWRTLTQKRIDVVAQLGLDTTIVEVKDRITPGAAGQLLVYRALWLQRHPGTTVVGLLAIGRGIVSELAPIFNAQGVTVENYP